jgi:hypothetical protein
VVADAAAMPALNAVPAVCAAEPGLLGPLDVPRYWTRNIPAVEAV